jgi:hypothetical protein
MNQIETLAMLLLAASMLMTSCSQEDDLIEEELQTSTISWVEPFHEKGASIEDVKSFMASKRNDLTLSELSSSACIQLVYSAPGSLAGVMYSFYSFDRTLYSVIDTEPMSNWSLVQDYLQEHYTTVSVTTAAVMLTSSDKSVIINMVKVSDEYFNLTCDFTR